IEDVFKQVRREVADVTGGEQTPWENTSLFGDFRFVPPDDTGPGGPALIQGGGEERMATERLAADRVFWESVKGSASADDFEAYLGAFPEGVFASLARSRLRNLGIEKGSEDNEWPPVPGGGTAAEWQPALQLGHLGEVTSVVFSPGGRTNASGSGDGTVRLWESRTTRFGMHLRGLTMRPVTSG
ncbi:MAG: hypothetical protein OXI66_17690, partial [Boseongicola sp.]|nr:hypothetical protein [Boseongicola sp.]MDE0347589.1 hypothetical protein [Boseongicola sp.]